MHKRMRHLAAAAALLVSPALIGAACGGDTASSASNPASTADLPQGNDPVRFDPADFTTNIDNEYWPMEPGTRWTYREVDEKGIQYDVVVTVTDQTKEVANGVTARVIRDTVTQNGEVVEDTFDWYAQDADGNIWYLGEDTAEFENGVVTSQRGSWEAGVDGALPGVMVPADPRPGLAYRQEYYAGKAEDNGEVLSIDEMADVPHGHFEHMMLTKDTIAIEPDVLEYKLYAKGVGPALVLGVSGGGGTEQLVKVDRAPAGFGTGPLGSPNG